VPPSRCATTACAGNANQLLADHRRRVQLQPLSKRCTKELRSWRARAGRLLERPASRGLLPLPPAGCQPSPRRPFCCHFGHQKFVSDDMSTGCTTPRPYDRRLIDRPSKVSELGGPLAVLGKLWDRSAGRSLASAAPPGKSVIFVSPCITLYHNVILGKVTVRCEHQETSR
jgi:hypothetical protein